MFNELIDRSILLEELKEKNIQKNTVKNVIR